MLSTNRNTINIDSKDMTAILFRNFAGKPDNFNPKGAMPNFTVCLSDERAKQLEAEGLDIKWRQNPDGDQQGRLKVFVRFENFPPKVFRITKKNTVELNADTVALLDHDEIKDADLIISPYHYDFNGRKGTKAYLSKGYFTIAEDQYAERYLGPQRGDAADTDDDLPF